MNDFNLPGFEHLSSDDLVRNKVNSATLRSADALPSLKEQGRTGEGPGPEAMFDAVTADITVKKLASLLEIASQMLNGKLRGPCGICKVDYRNLRRIRVVLCSDHCQGPPPLSISIEPLYRLRWHRISRNREILTYLSRLFGRERIRSCLHCSVDILGFTTNPLGKEPIGTGILNNGVYLVFNLCKDETLR